MKGLKFYKEFGNGSYAEVAESELKIKYEKDNEILSAKPETFSPSKSGGAVGSYRFTYSFADATNTAYVTFQVDRAKSSEFTATLSQSTWHFGDKTATITLKNPAGTTMKLSQSYYETGAFTDSDDSEYSDLSLYAMTKSYYNGHKNAVTYSALTTIENEEGRPNCGYNKVFGENLLNYSENGVGYNGPIQGDYVLFACVFNTRNYREIVCTTEFTVTAPDSPFSKTFVLTDLTARGDGDSEAPGDSAVIAAAMKKANLGKTAICAADGKLTGTFAFSEDISLNELTGDDALTLTFGSETDVFFVSVKNGYDDENKMELTGTYYNGVLTLTIQQWTTGETPIPYYFIFTFVLQTAGN